jgi:hypothetical protein
MPDRLENPLAGPDRFFASHPLLHGASFLAAGAAGVVFVARAARSTGWRRWAWLALATLQVLQATGIWRSGAGLRQPAKAA